MNPTCGDCGATQDGTNDYEGWILTGGGYRWLPICHRCYYTTRPEDRREVITKA